MSRTIPAQRPSSPTDELIETDVLVVGAGPAGLTTAITLARHGVRVLVAERHPSTSIFPKATGISTRTMELLRAWGLEEAVRAHAMDVRPFFSITPSLDQHGMVVPLGFPSDELSLQFSPTTTCVCPQDALEPLLVDHLRSIGGDVRFDTEVLDFTLNDDGVDATVVERETQERRVVRSAYVVGADGPNSKVRAALGIDVEVLGELGDYVSMLFNAHLEPADERCGLYSLQGPNAGGVLVPSGRDDRWVFATEWHPETGERVEDYTAERFTARIRSATGRPDLEPEFLARMAFTMRAQVATTFRSGRGFVVGDAAHQMTPVGGVGMNTAIHSAHNLGWKLAYVVRGWADETLLDTYEAERRPVGLRNAARSLVKGEKAEAEGLADDLHTAYCDGCSGADGLTVSWPPDGRPGARAPHVLLDLGGARRSSVELFEGELTLVVGQAAGPEWRAAAQRVGSCSAPLTTYVVGEDLLDDGTLAVVLGIGGTGASLVRPDGHVAVRWAGLPADPTTALSEAIAQTLGCRVATPVG
jgi:2-polyprenyl-6-methoxyphenol hydroxylase-like FAD-dependent oxidoreductase